MNAENKRKKQKVKEIKYLDDYLEYASKLKLTDEQRKIMDFIFVRGWNYKLIGDTLGYSEDSIKKKVRQILDLL